MRFCGILRVVLTLRDLSLRTPFLTDRPASVEVRRLPPVALIAGNDNRKLRAARGETHMPRPLDGSLEPDIVSGCEADRLVPGLAVVRGEVESRAAAVERGDLHPAAGITVSAVDILARAEIAVLHEPSAAVLVRD